MYYLIVAYPVFNFVNHNYHGVDTSRYYEGIEEENAFEAEGKSSEAEEKTF